MKVLVLGGHGHTGRLLMAKLPDAKAPTRAECDVTKQPDLERALEGCEAVAVILSPKSKADPVRSVGAVALVAAMKAKGVRRVVWVSASGVGDSIEGAVKTSFVFGKIIVPLVLKRQFADAGAAEETLRASGLEFTVLRPTELVDGERPGDARAVGAREKAPSAKITRAQLAGFIARELATPAHVGKMPVLCG